MSVSLGSSQAEAAQAEAVRDGRARVAVSVEELRSAWAAVVAGEFRRPAPMPTSRPTPSWSLSASAPADADHAAHASRTVPDAPVPARTSTWEPATWGPATSERVLPVIGGVGSCGATTLSLAVATAAHAHGRRARVVECASLSATGLAAASTSELGTDPSTGWARGIWAGPARAASGLDPAAGAGAGASGVVLERVGTVLTRADEVPSPAAGGFDLTVLDVGWEPGQLLATPSWVTDQVLAQPGVAVTTATAPGLRRLELTLSMLPRPHSWCVAVVGPRRRRWPPIAAREVGPLTGALLDAGRLIEVPVDRHLAAAGLSGDPLPRALLAAGTAVINHLATAAPPEHLEDDFAEALNSNRTETRAKTRAKTRSHMETS